MTRLSFTLGLLLLATVPASAGPLYSCPAGNSECAGQTFAMWIKNSGAGFFDLALSIDTTGYKGRPLATPGDYAYGVEFRNVITTNEIFVAASLLSAPGGTASWTTHLKQLSQDCGPKGDKQNQACGVWSAAGPGYLFDVGETLTWVFHVETAAALTEGMGHLKYAYRDASGRKTAGYLSEDIDLQDCRNGLCDDPELLQPIAAPEPATLTMLGLGLLGLAKAGRRGRPRS